MEEGGRGRVSESGCRKREQRSALGALEPLKGEGAASTSINALTVYTLFRLGYTIHPNAGS